MAAENPVVFAEIGNPKRVTQLTENTSTTGIYFLTEKAGEPEAKKTAYATVENAVKAKIQGEYVKTLSATPSDTKTMSEKLELAEFNKRDVKIVQLEQGYNFLQATITLNNNILTVSAGYLFTPNYTFGIAQQSMTLPDANMYYCYLVHATSELYLVRYDLLPKNKSDVLVAMINPDKRSIKVSAEKIIIDSEEIFYFKTSDVKAILDMQKNIYATLPNIAWLNKSYNENSALGEIFLDKRCIISRNEPLLYVNINCGTNGKLFVVLVDKNSLAIIKEVEIECKSGFNKIPASSLGDLEDIIKPMYICVKGVTAAVRTIYPADGNIFGATLANGALVDNNYSFAYTIEVDNSNPIVDRLSALENKIGTGGDDINFLLSKSDIVTLEPRDYMLAEPIVLTSGKTLKGYSKTRLILQQGVNIAIQADNAENVTIEGIEIVGNQADYAYSQNGINSGDGIINTADEAVAKTYMGTEIGIHLLSCEKVILSNIKIRNITGSAMRINRVGRDYIWGMKVSNLFISNCYSGIYCENEHEFSNYNNFNISLCQVGMYIESGNLQFTNGIITRCRVGVLLKDGYNNAHGTMCAMEVKHHQLYGILIDNVSNGQMMSAIYLQYANILIRKSKAIYFSEIHAYSATITCEGVGIPDRSGRTGKNIINNLCKFGEAVTVNNTGNLTVVNEIDLN